MLYFDKLNCLASCNITLQLNIMHCDITVMHIFIPEVNMYKTKQVMKV